MAAPCVLASERPSRPESERRSTKPSLATRVAPDRDLLGLAGLLAHHVKAVVLFNDLLEINLLVPGHDRKKRRVGANPLVLLEGQLDWLGARGVPALAEELRLSRRHAEGVLELLEPFVDLAENRLVAPDSLLAVVQGHRLSAAREPETLRSPGTPAVPRAGREPVLPRLRAGSGPS